MTSYILKFSLTVHKLRETL